MPLREYRCSACQEVLEVLELGRADDRLPACDCGSTELVRIPSTFAARPNGIRAEVAPPAPRKGKAPRKARKKHDGRTTIERVTNRIVADGQKPGGKPVTREAARAIATRTRLRKERRKNR
jgi:putative FmdB family regulatory protein